MAKINVGNKQVLAIFWRAIRQHKAVLFLILLTIIFVSAVDIFVPIFYKRFFDIISGGGAPAAIAPQLVRVIFIILLFNIATWVGYRFITFADSYFVSHVSAKLKQQAFAYLMQHSYAFFTNNFVGSLVQKVNRLGRSFEAITDKIYWSLLPLLIRIIGATIVLWFINPTMAQIMLAWAIMFLLFNAIFAAWKIKYDIKRAAADSKTTGFLADAITNHNTLHLFTGLGFEQAGYKKVTEEQRDITYFNWKLEAGAEAVQATFFIAVEFILFYYAIGKWQAGLVTVGTFVLLQSYLLSLIIRIWDFGKIIRNMYESFADAREMAEILYLPHQVRDLSDAKKLSVAKGEARFKNVGFRFNHGREVFKDFNLLIKPGEKIALVGPSGSGKSTIVKLLFRFYDVGSGAILIDKQDISCVTQESLRQNLSLVPQDPILFHRTLRENIRYGRRDASDEEVGEAARLAHCTEFIKGMPDGFNTYVGERGIKLSGGERQRVAIARAMLKNAPILVLDEATSSLDSHSESLIQDALTKLMKGKTTIVIAHRLSTIRKMDRILVIDKGKIIAQGKHNELIAQKGSLYNKLWTLQAGGFLPEEEEED